MNTLSSLIVSTVTKKKMHILAERKKREHDKGRAALSLSIKLQSVQPIILPTTQLILVDRIMIRPLTSA